jgi:hypothetical protein
LTTDVGSVSRRTEETSGFLLIPRIRLRSGTPSKSTTNVGDRSTLEPIADEEYVTGGEDDVRWPPESERGESNLERGPDTVSEAGRSPPAQDETGQEEFEPGEQGKKDIQVREDRPRPEGPIPVEEDVGRYLCVDTRIAPP